LIYCFVLIGIVTYTENLKGKIMSKGQDSKKNSKKEPKKTMQEKKKAKREKKNEKKGQGILNQ
jgi:hypothetical protein